MTAPAPIVNTTEGYVTLVRRVLRAQLLTVDGLPDESTSAQWEGDLTFTPTIGTPWFRETMLRPPGAPQRTSLGPQAYIRHTGGYQVSLFYPPNAGSDVLDIETIAERIRSAFPDTFETLINGQRFRSLGTGLGTVTPTTVQGNAWLHLPCRVSWEGYTVNDA